VQALDHLLHPLETLREELPDETPPDGVTERARDTPSRLGIDRFRVPSPSLFAERLAHSKRTPYPQIREAFFWCLYVTGLIGIAWVVVTHA
jgi:hypothetical protein